jgi:hypothetical protein
MPRTDLAQRVSLTFLCAGPFFAIALTAIRSLRTASGRPVIGAVLFLALVGAAWNVGVRAIGAGTAQERRLALAGGLLVAPFALIALLWVGLGTPWEATSEENEMRYLVLLAGAMAVATGFLLLKEALSEADEHLYSTFGLSASIFAGTAYLVWMSFTVGIYVVKIRDGQLSPTMVAVGDVFDVLLFVGCALTYVATAAFAASLGQARWLGRIGTLAFESAALLALLLLALRGLSYPDPGGPTPWYVRPGFIAGIPAIPWIMPYLIGVVVIRRAGNSQGSRGARAA